MQKQISSKIVSLVFAVLVVGFLAVFYVFAWTEPLVAPPGGNVPAPINVGSISQIKEGGFGVYGVFRAVGGADPTVESGLVVNNGDVGIGTPTPSTRLEIAGQVKITGGTPGVGKILTSDDTGLASWQEAVGSSIPVGAIMLWPTNTPPTGYLLANGQAISRAAYSSLFSVIGTTYGAGDGSTTFNLPNLRGRVAVGYDSSQTEFDILGETGGAKTNTLTTAQIPSHTHSGGFLCVPSSGSGTSGSYDRDCYNVSTGSTGGGEPHNNLQPYLVLNYIIKL